MTQTERDSGGGRGGRTGRKGRGRAPVGPAPGRLAPGPLEPVVANTAETDLTQVLHAAPAAVVLVDLTEQTVIYANAAANAMTGGLGLPADVDEWSQAAGLTDSGGVQLRDTASPLSRSIRNSP